ncbi:MAG: diguanylate cyclase [Gammaproteobacteria bacterium]|nr:diguanylate cyclase [Gammaproteobacteria bacterium]
MLVIGILSFQHTKKSLEYAVLDGLETIAAFKEGELFLYLEKLKTTTTNFASDGFIRDSLDIINNSPNDANKSTQALNSHLLKNKLPLSPSLLFIDVINLSGQVKSSTDKNRIGRDISTEKLFLKGLKKLYISNIHGHDDNMMIAVATPLWSRTGPKKILGLLVNHFYLEHIKKLFNGELLLSLGAKSQKRGIGKTGETYLVNHNKLMIGDSLFIKNASLRQVVDTYPVRMSIEQQKEAKGTWLDYRGVPVVGASMVINISDLQWTLISKQDASEAFAQIDKLMEFYITIGFSILISAIVLSIMMARSISRPINSLKTRLDDLGDGNYCIQIQDINSKDEIGSLAKAFNQMSINLSNAHIAIKTKNKQLEELSNKDGLTGLYNHRYLNEQAMIEYNRAFRYGTPLSCLMIDIDFFKKINDTYGHLFGDTVLKGVAATIKNSCRNTDIVARYGGEEFFVILPNTYLESAQSVSEKLLESISSEIYSENEISASITVSIGLSCFHEGMNSFEDLLSESDEALYQAKNSGRNRVCVFKELSKEKTLC